MLRFGRSRKDFRGAKPKIAAGTEPASNQGGLHGRVNRDGS